MKVVFLTALVIALIGALSIPKIVSQKDGVTTPEPVNQLIHIPRGVKEVKYDGVRYVLFRYRDGVVLLNKDSL